MNKDEFLEKANKNVRKPIPGIEGAYMAPLLWEQWVSLHRDKKKAKDSVLWTLAYTIQDEDGVRIFEDGDIELLRKTLQSRVGTQLNLLSFEVNDIDLKELEKNS